MKNDKENNCILFFSFRMHVDRNRDCSYFIVIVMNKYEWKITQLALRGCTWYTKRSVENGRRKYRFSLFVFYIYICILFLERKKSTYILLVLVVTTLTGARAWFYTLKTCWKVRLNIVHVKPVWIPISISIHICM